MPSIERRRFCARNGRLLLASPAHDSPRRGNSVRARLLVGGAKDEPNFFAEIARWGSRARLARDRHGDGAIFFDPHLEAEACVRQVRHAGVAPRSRGFRDVSLHMNAEAGLRTITTNRHDDGSYHNLARQASLE